MAIIQKFMTVPIRVVFVLFAVNCQVLAVNSLSAHEEKMEDIKGLKTELERVKQEAEKERLRAEKEKNKLEKIMHDSIEKQSHAENELREVREELDFVYSFTLQLIEAPREEELRLKEEMEMMQEELKASKVLIKQEKQRAEQAIMAKEKSEKMVVVAEEKQKQVEEALKQAEEELLQLIEAPKQPSVEEVKVKKEIEELQQELRKAEELVRQEKQRAEEAITAKEESEKMVYAVKEKQMQAEKTLKQAGEKLQQLAEAAKQPSVEKVKVEEKIERLQQELRKAEELVRQEKQRAEEAIRARDEFEKIYSEGAEVQEVSGKDSQAESPRPALQGAEGTEATLKNIVLFDLNDTSLKPSGRRIVDYIAETLIIFPLQKAKIVGHADIFEDEPDIISMNRAEAIRAYLMKEFDISSDRLVMEDYGADSLVADPSTEDGMAQNRRVEMNIVK